MRGDDDDDDLDEQFDHDRSNFLPWTTESIIDDIEKPRNKHFSRTKKTKNLAGKIQAAEQPTTIFEKSRRIELKSQTCKRVITANKNPRNLASATRTEARTK